MNYIKKISKSLLISFSSLFISIFLFTLLEYIGLISNNAFKIIITIITFLVFMIGGVIFGMKSNKKGWLEGIKLSIVEIIIIAIINILMSSFGINNWLIYIIMFLATTTGSIIGVNKNNLAK